MQVETADAAKRTNVAFIESYTVLITRYSGAISFASSQCENIHDEMPGALHYNGCTDFRQATTKHAQAGMSVAHDLMVWTLSHPRSNSFP